MAARNSLSVEGSDYSATLSQTAIACQLAPGLGLTGPPPAIAFPFISQIEAWPLVF